MNLTTDALFAPAEAVRRAAWRLATTTTLGRRCATDRSMRLLALGTTQILVALTLTVVAPLWLLLIGPLILGVPHIAADIRYLIARPLIAGQSNRAFVAVVAIPVLGLVACRVLLAFDFGPFEDVEVGLGIGGILGAIVMSNGSIARRACVGAVASALGFIALRDPYLTALVFAHVHHLVAVGLWLGLSAREPHHRRYVFVALGIGVVAALLALGAFDPIVLRLRGFVGDACGLDLETMTETLAPGLDMTWAARLVLFYAFGQAMHYTVWLRLMPATGRFGPRAVAPSFRRTYSAWRHDLGSVGVAIAVALSLLVPALALFNPLAIRTHYLTFVGFHGWLEVMAVGVLLASVRRRA